MSWKSGIDFVEWAMDLSRYKPFTDARIDTWVKFIKKLDAEDCDILHDCLGKDPDYDCAYYEIFPKED